MARSRSEMIRRFIVEHAHRMIMAVSPDEEIARLRPRTVSQDLFRAETERWRTWHDEQTAAERKLMGWETSEGNDR